MLKGLFALLICVFVVCCSTKVPLLTGKYTLQHPFFTSSEINLKKNGHFIRRTHFFESSHDGRLTGTWKLKNDTLILVYNRFSIYNDTFKVEAGNKGFCSFKHLSCYKKN